MLVFLHLPSEAGRRSRHPTRPSLGSPRNQFKLMGPGCLTKMTMDGDSKNDRNGMFFCFLNDWWDTLLMKCVCVCFAMFFLS